MSFGVRASITPYSLIDTPVVRWKSALARVTTTRIGFTFGTVQPNNPIFRYKQEE
jgi:hypothetical protein